MSCPHGCVFLPRSCARCLSGQGYRNPTQTGSPKSRKVLAQGLGRLLRQLTGQSKAAGPESVSRASGPLRSPSRRSLISPCRGHTHLCSQRGNGCHWPDLDQSPHPGPPGFQSPVRCSPRGKMGSMTERPARTTWCWGGRHGHVTMG